MRLVKPKKALGQHFLKDLQIAQRIADTLDTFKSLPVLEIGPGMGVLRTHNPIIVNSCLFFFDTFPPMLFLLYFLLLLNHIAKPVIRNPTGMIMIITVAQKNCVPCVSETYV